MRKTLCQAALALLCLRTLPRHPVAVRMRPWATRKTLCQAALALL